MTSRLNWTPFTGAELLKVSCLISVADRDIGYLDGVSWCQPSFYESAKLVAPDNKRAKFVYDGKSLVKLTGMRDQVLRANEIGDLVINSETAIEYMTFFAENISTCPGETFHVVREGDKVVDPSGKDIDIEYPCRIESLSLSTHFMKAMVIYSGALFQAIMFCDDKGAVTMVDDLPLGVALLQTPSP